MNEKQNDGLLNETDIEVELFRLLRTLWKHAWIVFIAAMLGGSLAYLGTKYFIAPTYRSGFTAYVNNRSGNVSADIFSLTSSDLQASQALVETYARILTSRSVLVSAAEQADIEYGYEELKKMADTNIVGDTEVISMEVTTEDPEESLKLALAIEEIASEKVAAIVEGSSMKTIDEPILADKPYGPGFGKNLILGILTGTVLAVIGVLFVEVMDDRVKSEEELEERLGITILGTIPDLESASHHSYGYGYESKTKGREAQ